MKRLGAFLALLLLAGTALAQENLQIEVPVAFLNQLVASAGPLSGGGTTTPMRSYDTDPLIELCFEPIGFFECPHVQLDKLGWDDRIPIVRCRTVGGGIISVPVADPVPYEWSIHGARYAVVANQLEFSATIHYKVDGDWKQPIEVEAEANVILGDRLYLAVEAVSVPLTYTFLELPQEAERIEVGRLYTLAVPVEALDLELEGIGDDPIDLTARLENWHPTYSADKIVVDFDAKFE